MAVHVTAERPGSTIDSSRSEIDAILARDPTATAKTGREYADDQAGELNTLLNLFYGLLALSVIIALLAVANTMTLSIHERTRELGLLRAVGMSSPQLRSAVRSEAALIGMVGSLLGLVLGLFFGWLAYRVTSETFPVFNVPWIQLIAIAIVGMLAGLLAGWRPALASRTKSNTISGGSPNSRLTREGSRTVPSG